MTRSTIALALVVSACGGADPTPRSSPPDPASSPSNAAPTAAATSAAPLPATPAAEARPALATTDRFRVERLLEGDVRFLVTGEEGRIGALASEAGTVVPHRFERGKWEKLALPGAQQTTFDAASLGIFFGRDNRPRLMGHREAGGSRRMVYLRFRDGAWQDQRSEIGALAGDGSQLFGVLGEADPEVVCKVGGTCLVKSRKGWKEIPNTIPANAVVREYGGKGWALTTEGIFRADDGGFVRVGPPAAWKNPATGFWIGANGDMAVVEPATDAIYRADAGSKTWSAERSPLAHPRDVGGSPSDRWVVGEDGLAHGDGTTWARVGGASLRLWRWIATADGGLAGGPSGVYAVRPGGR